MFTWLLVLEFVLGSFCNCILPESIQLSTVGQPEALEFSGKFVPKNLVFFSSCLVSDEIRCFIFIVDDNDGSEESVASSLSDETDGEGQDHHLITAPNSDIAYLQDRPVRLARELLQEPSDGSPMLKRS